MIVVRTPVFRPVNMYYRIVQSMTDVTPTANQLNLRDLS